MVPLVLIWIPRETRERSSCVRNFHTYSYYQTTLVSYKLDNIINGERGGSRIQQLFAPRAAISVTRHYNWDILFKVVFPHDGGCLRSVPGLLTEASVLCKVRHKLVINSTSQNLLCYWFAVVRLAWVVTSTQALMLIFIAVVPHSFIASNRFFAGAALMSLHFSSLTSYSLYTHALFTHLFPPTSKSLPTPE